MDLLMQQLRRLVRYLMPCEPRCFSIMGEMLSGPMALEDLLFFMACLTWISVMIISGSSDFLRRLRLMFLASLVGIVVALGVNCLLNMFAIFLGLL